MPHGPYQLSFMSGFSGGKYPKGLKLSRLSVSAEGHCFHAYCDTVLGIVSIVAYYCLSIVHC